MLKTLIASIARCALVSGASFAPCGPNDLNRRGCCSHHNGVCGCNQSTGMQSCCDGTDSPSCRCGE